MDFQEAPRIGADPAERILAMRRKGWSPTGIEPVTGLDRAIIDRSMVVPLGEILAPLHGMVPLIRGRIWVPASQRGEAESFLPLGPPETDAGTLRTMVDRGIPAVGWVEMQERVDRAARDFVPGLGTLLLTAQELRGTRADPVDLIAQGSLPGSAEIAAFEGDGVAVLREGGARVVRYQGRLARFHGDDWPRAWAVLELRTLPVLVADPRP
jgi:hypothetical protein